MTAGILAAAITVAAALASQGDNTTVGVGAHTSFDRTWNWVVSKTDDQHSSVTVAQHEVFNVGYTITVGNGNPPTTDSNWAVQDGIFLFGGPFTVNSQSAVTASATQDGGTVTTAATIQVCATDSLYQSPISSYPYTGPPFGCHYTIALPDGTPGTVTAKVNFADGSSQTGSTSFDFAGGAGSTLEAGQPVIKAGSVNVVDSQAGVLGTVTAPVDALHPQTFHYSVPVDTSTCGSFDMPNTVNLIDPQTGGTVASASDTVHVTVTCPHVNGCTLTQGYWKTHSIYGPAAKPDPAWNLLANGPNTPFFKSGQTWLQVFNTPPAGGNVYYILAHQYEAAVLNKLNGASSTAAVDATMADAVTFFNSYTPAQAGALANNSAARKAANADASTLDNYNSGLIGPGHCGENS
jgi:hypothetical protein